MNELRQKFEALPEICSMFDGLHQTIIWFCEQSSKYATSFSGFDNKVIWLNGAWYAFQEQQKKIDVVLKYIDDEKWVDEYGDYHCPVLKIKELLK